MTTGITDNLDFLTATRLAGGDERFAFIDANGNVKDRSIGKLFAALDRKIALFDIETDQTACRVLGDETQEDAARILDDVAEFGFPVLAGKDLLFVEPNQKAFILELFNDVLSDQKIGRNVAYENTAGGAMS